MRTDDFHYHLPSQCIAQQPVTPRDACRLLVLSKGNGRIEHCSFRDIVTLLSPGDRLVFNNTRVIPARVLTRKYTGGKCELLFLESVGTDVWKALVKPGSNAPKNGTLHVEENPFIIFRIVDVLPGGERLVKTDVRSIIPEIEDIMEQYGHVPLPHYIERNDTMGDKDDYQTVYASVPGAVAAPTAGLHFTDKLVMRLKEKDVAISYITLHVGIGTFRPVKTEWPHEHRMHSERYQIGEDAVTEIERTKSSGGRIISVGTTVVRVLEHCMASMGKLGAHKGTTDIMILPPYHFKCIDGLITNFHLPKSTLIMLVSAFGGYEHVMNAYNEAVEAGYRFYSYGDAMLII